MVRTKSEPSTKSMHMRTKIGTSRKLDFTVIYYYPIDEKVLQKPNSSIRRRWKEITGSKHLDPDLIKTESDRIKVVKKLLEKTFHERCYFVSKGEPCIDIIDANDKYNYDDYQGWKGLVAYCTKKMYNPDMMLEVFDNQNSTLTIKR